MNRRRLTTAITTVAVLTTGVFFVLPAAPPAVDVATHTIVVDDVERSYRIAVPHELNVAAPVVFAFHGIGDSSDSMATYSQLDRVASEHGFLLIYPSGLNAKWAASNVAPRTLDANPDVRFFDALLKHIAAQYAIDDKRLYLIGMSNGASFVQLLANARSSDIAAVVACSGQRPRILNDARRSFPILLIVGDDDMASGSMESDHDYYRAAGHEADLIIVRGLGHEWSPQHNTRAWDFMASHQLAP